MDIDVFIQGNADFRVTTGKSRRSIQGASRARHARLPFNRAAAIYRLRSTGCQGVGARIEDLETSLSFTQIGTKAGRVFFEHFADTPRDNYALCGLQEVLLASPKQLVLV